MVTRESIADVLEEIALLLELKGENPFKVRAYRTGAEVVLAYSGDFLERARQGELDGIKGIGDALAAKIHELASTGKLDYHRKLRGEFPETIFELFAIQGLGAKKIKALHEELGISSLADLRKACEDGRVAELAGFGEKSQDKILEAIEFQEQNAGRFRQDDVAALVERVHGFLRELPAVSQVAAAGSWRRGKETLHDLDFIVATASPADVIERFVSAPFAAKVLSQGDTKASIRLEGGVQCDLRAVSNEEYPFALLYFTGSKEHNVALRGRAQKLGYSLNEYRLSPTRDDVDDVSGRIHDEAGVYRALGLEFIEPELRENTGEIEAAEAGELPRLVELANLRGTFHCHTTASDGHHSLEEMAEAARELGLQYLGIADHSKSSFQANGLDEKRLLEQVERVRELNRGFDGFRLFAGTECDIRKDGTLDFPDDVLAQLDYVVASVHNVFTLPEAEMTRRIIRAIESPHVTMLGHLSGRLLLRREPYAVDIPAVIEAAAATGTIIELNANPWRLDMDWRWWKLAAEKGVLCAINPDAHSIEGLQDLFYGVRIARKGWLGRDSVVNCLPLGRIEAVLEAKLAGSRAGGRKGASGAADSASTKGSRRPAASAKGKKGGSSPRGRGKATKSGSAK